MIVDAFKHAIRSTDAAMARVSLSVCSERPGLLAFLFHSLFRDEREMETNVVDPLERTTVDQFRNLIQYYLGCGYRFIGPDQLLSGLPADGKYAIITFDDGYYNNVLALPILRQFNVPAIIFPSTDHIRDNKSFWWDVLYRQRIAEGATNDQIYMESLALKLLPTEEVESQLMERYGAKAFLPRGDVDRPFTPAELRHIAGLPGIYLGNHTAGHAILTKYVPAEARRQIVAAQDALAAMACVQAQFIAYPNGAYNHNVLRICSELGLKGGFTVQPRKTAVPLDVASAGIMHMGRFVPHPGLSMASQLRAYRSDFQIYGTLRNWYVRLRGDGVTQ